MTTLLGDNLLYGSSDSGRTWRTISIPKESSKSKYGIQLIDERHGLVQLGSGILATADGGRNWQPVPLPPGYTFGLGAQFLTASRGWYQDIAAYPDQTAQPSSMWWTSNAGASWSLVWQVSADHPAAGPIPLDGTKYVLGFDGSLGWLTLRLASSHRLLQTQDGGHTWAEVFVPVSEPALLYRVEVLPDGSAILLARAGEHWWAIRSRDGGRTWTDSRPLPVAVPASPGVYGRPAFIDRDHWMVAAGSVIRATSNGGLTSRDVRSKLPAGIETLHDLWVFPGGNGLATGADAGGSYHVMATTDGGLTWSLSPVPHL